MDTGAPRSTLRPSVSTELQQLGIKASPQAITAIAEAVANTPAGRVGDSDSLLLGLLRSGSYAVDSLELCGADLRRLLIDVEYSVSWHFSGDAGTVNEFFHSGANTSSLLLQALRGKRHCLECADILRAAIVPDYSIDALSSITSKNWLRRQYEDLITGALQSLMSHSMGIAGDIRRRRRRLSANERCSVKSNWENEDVGEETIRAFDAWFSGDRDFKKFLHACPDALDLTFDIPSGASSFLWAGCDVYKLACLLESTRRLIPRRDEAGLFLFCDGQRIKAGQFTYRNSFFVDTGKPTGFPIERVAIEATRPVSLLSRHVIEEFEDVLSRDNVKELEIQHFLNQNEQFLMGLGYARARPHIGLTEEGSKELIPDYLLEIPGDRGFDILDLKLPKARVTARRPYLRLSSEVAKAVAQLRKYGRFFDRAENRKAFQHKYGLTPFKPGLVVVIGRSAEFQTPEERVEIEEQLGRIRLLTYDDLIEYGRTRQIDLPDDWFFD